MPSSTSPLTTKGRGLASAFETSVDPKRALTPCPSLHQHLEERASRPDQLFAIARRAGFLPASADGVRAERYRDSHRYASLGAWQKYC